MPAPLTIPDAAKAIALFGGTILLAALLFYVIRLLSLRLRDAYSNTPVEQASELMSRFRDLHNQGGLSSGEYQHIKERLTPSLQAEATADAAEAIVADHRVALREAAAFAAAKLADRNAGAENACEPEQRETADPADHAARGGCDAAPSAGGDSTREDR